MDNNIFQLFQPDTSGNMPLIIYRYLSKQILQIMFAVSLVVLLIIMSGRFVNYLAQAASGALKPEFLFSIMGYRIPEFLVMILPLSLFLGIILSHGRLYVDNEMTVLTVSGLGRNQLLLMTMIPAILVMLLVALLSLLVVPINLQKVEDIFYTQDSLTEFDTLEPRRFQKIGSSARVTYTEQLSNDRQTMSQVFIANRNEKNNNFSTMTILLASNARINNQTNEGKSTYLILSDGYRYDLTPGQLQLRETRFDTYGIKMPERRPGKEVVREQALSTATLLNSNSIKHIAELQWRISLPLLIPIIVVIALSLAKVKPRQGRYVKLLPGILIYLFYLVLLISARGAVDDGRLPPQIGLWSVHVIFLVIALVLHFYHPVKLLILARQTPPNTRIENV